MKVVLKRTGTLLAGLLLMVGVGAAMPSPAQAWSYCNHSDAPLAVTLYSGQGYCGSKAAFDLSLSGTCRSLTGYYGNYAAAAVNTYGYPVRLYRGIQCTGDSYKLGALNSHPNLLVTPVGYQDAESMRLCVSPC